MTRDFVSVSPATSAAEIAAALERHRVRHVLVTEWGSLRGVVTRSDLLRAVTAEEREPGDLPDTRIRAAVLAAMRRETWTDAAPMLVEVHDGIVEFHGYTPAPEVLRALRILAEHVPGVKGVLDCTEANLPPDPVTL